MSTSEPTIPGETAVPVPSSTNIVIGTRRSALALRQCELVIATLAAHHPHLTFQLRPMSVVGDADKSTPLSALSQSVGGKGLWTSELEAKLVAGELDMVVHSLKDMPTTLPDGCELGAVTKREDPRDVLVVGARFADHAWTSLADLPEGSVVGTSSVRRAAQVRARYADKRFVIRDIRGNIDTRLRKLDDPAEGYTAIILAAAGLLRMNQGARITQYLDGSNAGGGMLHAVGQGAMGVEIRQGDERVRALLRGVDDVEARGACEAERAAMRKLEGGCSVPIGVETEWFDCGGESPDRLTLRAVVVSVDGSRRVEKALTLPIGGVQHAVRLGEAVAAELVGAGAAEILAEINKTRDKGGLTVSS